MTSQGQLIVCDLDGTLLHDDKTISPFSEAIIASARDQGALFCLASGRPDFMMNIYYDQLGLNTPVISNNGALVIIPATGEILRETCLPFLSALAYLRFLCSRQLSWAVFTRRGIHFKRDPERRQRYDEYNHRARQQGQTEITLHELDSWEEAIPILQAGALRITALIRGPQDQQLVEGYFHSRAAGIDLVRSCEEAYDTVCSGVNKWKAVELIRRQFQIPAHQVSVFGNDPNDVEMMKNAANSFAVANAKPEVLKQAKMIIDENNKDGVAKAIQKHILGLSNQQT